MRLAAFPRTPALLAALGLSAASIAIAAPAPRGDPVRGERVYQSCLSCHSLSPREQYSGPSLHALIGRPIASEPDFDYTPALRALAAREKRWTPALLDRFMANPGKVAPRSNMTMFALPNARERADLIAFLARRQNRR